MRSPQRVSWRGACDGPEYGMGCGGARKPWKGIARGRKRDLEQAFQNGFEQGFQNGFEQDNESDDERDPDPMSRLSGRVRIIARALPRLALKALRTRPRQPSRILIAHHLLLGDTLLLTPLVAKLRARFPEAQIVLTCPKP